MISSNVFKESIPLSGGNEDSDSDYTLQSPLTDRRRRRPSLPPASLMAFKMLLSVLLSFILGVAISMASIIQINQQKQDADLIRQCAMRMSHYSPVLNEVDKKYSTTYFNGSFMQEMVYRQLGSPEVDAAWQALGIEYTYNIINYILSKNMSTEMIETYRAGDDPIQCLLITRDRSSIRDSGRGRESEWTLEAPRPTSKKVWRWIFRASRRAAPSALSEHDSEITLLQLRLL